MIDVDVSYGIIYLYIKMHAILMFNLLTAELFWEVDYTGTICSSPRVNKNFNNYINHLNLI